MCTETDVLVTLIHHETPVPDECCGCFNIEHSSVGLVAVCNECGLAINLVTFLSEPRERFIK